MKNLSQQRVIFVTSAIVLASLSRFLPHPPNFAPIAAIALFGGAYLNNKTMAYIITFAGMLLSDVFLGFHDTMWAVYACFAVTVFIGNKIAEKKSVKNIVTASVASSALFFIVTNFACWIGSPFYAQNVGGLVECYVSAIPFFSNTLVGDLFYTGVLFGAFYLAQLRFPQLAKSNA